MNLANIDNALFLIDSVFFPFPAAVDALRKIDSLMRTGQLRHGADVSFLVGPTRSGKTCIVDHFIARDEHKPTQTPLADLAPVVYVEAPFQSSRKALGEALLEALKHPKPRGSSGQNLASIESNCIYFLKERGVRLVIVDEVQQLSRSNAYLAADFFKTLTNRSRVPFLFCGLPDSLDMIRDNDQLLERRKDIIELRPFDWDDDRGRDEFTNLMVSYDNLLRDCRVLCRNFSFADEAVIKRVYWLTGGLAGGPSRFLRKALTIAKSYEISELTVSILVEAAEDSVETLGVNPFSISSLPEILPVAKFDSGVNRKRRRRKS